MLIKGDVVAGEAAWIAVRDVTADEPASGGGRPTTVDEATYGMTMEDVASEDKAVWLAVGWCRC